MTIKQPKVFLDKPIRNKANKKPVEVARYTKTGKIAGVDRVGEAYRAFVYDQDTFERLFENYTPLQDKWVNVYRNEEGRLYAVGVYDSPDEATFRLVRQQKLHPLIQGQTIKIQIRI